jgi:PBP1b-binding outer membrane lipoprotein LpoB
MKKLIYSLFLAAAFMVGCHDEEDESKPGDTETTYQPASTQEPSAP